VRNRKRKLDGVVPTEVHCPECDTVHISVVEEQLRAPEKTGGNRAEVCPHEMVNNDEGTTARNDASIMVTLKQTKIQS
jgi:hypothetical protein